MDQIISILIANWTIITSPAILYFLVTYFTYSNAPQTYNRSPNSWIYTRIDNINKEITSSRGYNNFIIPTSFRLRRVLEDAILMAENNNRQEL